MDSYYGVAAGSTIPALAIYQRLSQGDEASASAKYAATPAVANEISYVKQQIARMKTPDDLLSNYRVMKFVLSAFGLESQIQYTGLIRQVLQSDLTDSSSLANALKDPRFKQLATALDVQATGLATLQSASTLDAITGKYVTNAYEKSFDSQNPAIHQALYFLRNASGATDAYQILGDPTLRAVVTKTLGLPDSIAVQPIESQAALINARLDITQFSGTDKTAGPSAGQQADAQADLTALTPMLAAGDAAAGAASAIGARLQAVRSEYDNLAKVQDPAGVNAQEIPVQAAAEPQILRQQGLIGAAQGAIAQAAQDLNRMSQLRALAADPANAASLGDYKTEFAALAGDIHGAIAGSTYRTAGVDESLLNGTLAQPVTAQLDSAGRSVGVHPQDVGAFLAQVDVAAAAFAGLGGAGDQAGLAAVRGAIATGGPVLGAARDAVAADAAALDAGLATVPMWAAGVNSAAIAQGAAAVDDAQSRVQQIADTVAQIRALAATSAARDGAADRGDLAAQVGTLVSTLGSLVGTAGAGVDNLLNGGDRSYALGSDTTLSASGRDLAASVVAPLSGGDIGSAAGAQALVDRIDGAVGAALDDTQRRLSLDAAAFAQAGTVFDARGKADADFRRLAADMPGLIAGAASGGVNLLAAGQPDLTAFSQLQLRPFDMAAQPGFAKDVADVVSQAVAELPDNLSGDGGAYALLQSALFAANHAASSFGAARAAARDGIAQAQQVIQQAQAATAASGAQATGANAFTQRFVLRFLAMSDAESAASTLGIDASASGNVNVQLLGQIGGSTDLLA